MQQGSTSTAARIRRRLCGWGLNQAPANKGLDPNADDSACINRFLFFNFPRSSFLWHFGFNTHTWLSIFSFPHTFTHCALLSSLCSLISLCWYQSCASSSGCHFLLFFILHILLFASYWRVKQPREPEPIIPSLAFAQLSYIFLYSLTFLLRIHHASISTTACFGPIKQEVYLWSSGMFNESLGVILFLYKVSPFVSPHSQR